MQNYNQSSTGLTVSTNYLFRHSFHRVGLTYSFNKSSITAFTRHPPRSSRPSPSAAASRGRSPRRHLFQHCVASPTPTTRSAIPYNPHEGVSYTALLQVAGIGGNVKYYNPIFDYRHFNRMHGLKPSKEGRNVLAFRFQAQYIQGIGGKVAPPYQRFYQGGEQRCAASISAPPRPTPSFRSARSSTSPTRMARSVPRDPTNPTLGNVTIPMPIYGIVSIGGDTHFTSNIEYRIPIVGPVTFEFFDDFGMSGRRAPVAVGAERPRHRRSTRRSMAARSTSMAPARAGSACISPERSGLIEGTNLVPRMSTGAELSVILPIVNAPFRIYYAYNPLRLLRAGPRRKPHHPRHVPRGRGRRLQLRAVPAVLRIALPASEPRKTFRLAVSTTF